MSSKYTPTDCRFCSVVSQANGEDPLGTAPNCDGWLIIEMKLPWIRELLFKSHLGQQLFPQIRELDAKYGIKLMPILIARDREYSLSGYTRILYYIRPKNRLFAEFDKQEFIVPEANVLPYNKRQIIYFFVFLHSALLILKFSA